MKKLMTMLSAATVAIGLYGAGTGTSFEDVGRGEFSLNTPDDLNGTTGYWGSDTNTWEVKEGVSIPLTADKIDGEYPYPKQFRTSQTNYLHIASPFGNPLTRYVNNNSEHDYETIGDAFYFDSLVKFTAFDEGDLPVAVTNELASAKIAVWIQTSDNDTKTNLYVWAGQFDEHGEVQAHRYDCGSFSNADGWHRLTIKAIGNICKGAQAKPGFAVFVDNTIKNATDDSIGINESDIADGCLGFFKAGNLFPSIVQGTQLAGKIKSVSFDGQGDIDDIVFTRDQPFKAAKSAETVEFSWEPAIITNLTIASAISVDLANGKAVIPFSEGGMEVLITGIEYADGYMGNSSQTITYNAEKQKTSDITYSEVVAYFGETPYASVAEAVDAANVATVADTVLKFVKTTGAEVLIFTNESVRIVLDLNGRTIGSIRATFDDITVFAVSLKIVDSATGGKVSGGVILETGAISEIWAGTYDGGVNLQEYSIINGGRFKISENSIEDLNNAYTLPQYKEFKEGTEADEGYYILGDKSSGGEEIEPGKESATTYDSQEAAEAAASKVTIKASADVAAALGEDTATYLENFEAKAVEVGTTGKYKVEIVLKEAVETALTAQVGSDAAEIVSDLTAESVEFTTTPGFYYSIEYGTSLDDMAEGDRTMATGSTLELDIPTTPEATSGFYKVLVNVTDK